MIHFEYDTISYSDLVIIFRIEMAISVHIDKISLSVFICLGFCVVRPVLLLEKFKPQRMV